MSLISQPTTNKPIEMTNCQSKMIEMFNEKSIAQGHNWFGPNVYKEFDAETIPEKIRILNIRDSVLRWVEGDYSKAINVSFKKGELTLDQFNDRFEGTYGLMYRIMWEYSNVEKCEDLMDVLKQNGFILRRQRSFDGEGNMEFYFGIYTIEEAETSYMVRDPKYKPAHLCYCGCGEYQQKMKKTECCGRRYVNIVHQRSALVNKKCPCKAKN